MTLPSPMALRNARVGNDAGWLLAFHREKPAGIVADAPELWIGSDDLHAEIRATLNSGLEGGVFTFTLERLADEDYAKLAELTDGGRALGVVKLYLFWRDALGGVADYVTGLAGLSGLGDITPQTAGSDPVAVLAVTGLSRAVGARGVETTITCREHVFEYLSGRALCGDGAGIDLTSLEAAIQKTLSLLAIADRTKTYRPTVNDRCPAAPVAAPGGKRQQLEHGTRGTDCLRTLAGQLEQQTRRYGRGMLLIRNGTLHLGPRSIPLIPADGVKDLSVETGLVDTQALEPLNTDPGFDRCAKAAGKPLLRRQYKLVCKGRADLRPGDVVRFQVPKEEAPKAGLGGVLGLAAAAVAGPLLPSLGGVGEPSMRLYVNSVEHRLGRTSGFVTTLTGVELPNGVPDWDCKTPSRKREDEESESEAAGAETEAARAVRAVSRRAAAAHTPVDAGEVRTVVTTAGALPAQSLKLWRGLERGDGAANQSARLPVKRPSAAPATGVPYLTPFAFGKAGLVLPAYPGMRVAIAHRLGRHDDPLVSGALWSAGEAPAGQPGDWWLILPAAVPPNRRQTLPDTETSKPAPYSGKATDDLIDADGNRVIEAGELTVRVGKAALQPAGTRPARAGDAGSVTIEHADGKSRIVMEAGGNIRIETPGELEIKAANVKFKVTGTVDVGS